MVIASAVIGFQAFLFRSCDLPQQSSKDLDNLEKYNVTFEVIIIHIINLR